MSEDDGVSRPGRRGHPPCCDPDWRQSVSV